MDEEDPVIGEVDPELLPMSLHFFDTKTGKRMLCLLQFLDPELNVNHLSLKDFA
jgi:hypothetical protein